MSATAKGKRMSAKDKEKKGSTKRAKGGPPGRVDNTGTRVYDNWRKEARALGKEKKYVDILIRPLFNAATAAAAHVPTFAVPWNPVAQPLDNATCPAGILIPNLIPQGDTIATRKDNSIKLRSLYIKGMFRIPNNVGGVGAGTRELCENEHSTSAAVDLWINAGLIRVCVVYDESPNGVDPADTSVMFQAMFGLDGGGSKPAYVVPSTSTGNLQVTNAMNNFASSDAFQNMRGQGRFRLLADEYLPYGGCKVDAGSGHPSITFDGATPLIVPYSRYLKLGGIATHFSKSEANQNLSSIVKGGLYVICTYVSGPHNANVSNNPVFEGCLRLRFDD